MEFSISEDEDPESIDDVDAIITAKDGTRWSATLMTIERITTLMERWSGTGESLSGAYFQVRDLVIVRRGGLDAMALALEDIFREYGLATHVLPQLD
ncbi:hypothetical protein ACFYNY_24160 [Streptomyces sp. NPDC006530]|uniref:hypothetical protein n=1 Tax=Streptomyces sp. NPDC006530 TaxID=3364750 RepID=UPI0036B183F5